MFLLEHLDGILIYRLISIWDNKLLSNFDDIKTNETKTAFHLVTIMTDKGNTVMQLDTGGIIDGSKYICMDKLYLDIKNQECLVYSFGLSDDWTFEEVMADLGCKVKWSQLNIS